MGAAGEGLLPVNAQSRLKETRSRVVNMEETKPTRVTRETKRVPVQEPSGVSSSQRGVPEEIQTVIDVRNVDFHYGSSQALHGINLKVQEKQVTAFIGPSGCGKSTLLR